MNPVNQYPPVDKRKYRSIVATSAVTILAVIVFFVFQYSSEKKAGGKLENEKSTLTEDTIDSSSGVLDTALYDQQIVRMVNGDTSGRWPAKHDYPLPGAILPFKTIVAYYGNLYSKQMGILGELPKKEMLEHLRKK